MAKGRIVAGQGSVLDGAFKTQLKLIAAKHPGVLIEDKGYSLALHYRLAPKQGVPLIHDVKHAYEAWGDKSIEMLTGKAVIELKFAGFNKGTAVRALDGISAVRRPRAGVRRRRPHRRGCVRGGAGVQRPCHVGRPQASGHRRMHSNRPPRCGTGWSGSPAVP